MKTQLIEGLTTAGLESYLTARQYEALYWPNFFPIKNVNTLDGKTVIGAVGSRVAAYVIPYNTKAPVVGRKGVSMKYFDIPKTAIAREKDETAILQHRILRAYQGQNAVIEDIYNDVDFVFDSVQARMEWYALTAMSTGKMQLSTTNNPQGIINETVIDFGLPTANKKVVSVVWSVANVATMDPLKDFKEVVKAARAKGITFRRILMNADEFDLMCLAEKFQAYFKNTALNVTALMSLETINALLNSYQLPPISIIDTSINIEGKDGTLTAVNPWDTNHVLFVPDLRLGEMFNGPIAEELEPPQDVVQAKRGNILVSVKKFWDPVSIKTKAECNVFPSWPSVDRCFSLYTNSASTWA